MSDKKSYQLTKLWESFNKRCWYCDRRIELRDATRDHMIPLANGGQHNRWNVVLSCRPCNEKKGARPYLDFIRGKEST